MDHDPYNQTGDLGILKEKGSFERRASAIIEGETDNGGAEVGAGTIRYSIDGFLIVRIFSYPASDRLGAVGTIRYSIDSS